MTPLAEGGRLAGAEEPVTPLRDVRGRLAASFGAELPVTPRGEGGLAAGGFDFGAGGGLPGALTDPLNPASGFAI